MEINEKFKGCLLGGAIGDALGYPIEFMSLNQIKHNYGLAGLRALIENKESRVALISDDTQMTLFTADGLVWASRRCSDEGFGIYTGSGIYQSYLRWLYTQTGKIKEKDLLQKTSILDKRELFSRRAPGNTCLSALESGVMGTIDKPINHSKGCGGVMRVAPVGLFLHKNPVSAFQTGAEIAAITHGHPTGYLSAGAFSMIISEILNEKSIEESINSTVEILKGYAHHEETLAAIQKAIKLTTTDISHERAIREIGEGWIAEEALAIALYCALKESDFEKALLMSVNHDGDSDSTGSICGNILGARLGVKGIPVKWLAAVELRSFVEIMAEKLYETSELKKEAGK
ncbi:MAG: ADP-ribosylglycohydrolase family protein [Clostridiaceae bacterium]